MRAPKPSAGGRAPGFAPRVRAPRPKVAAPKPVKGGRYGAREASAKDEIADGGGDNPFAKSPRQYRVTSGDTGEGFDGFE
ncbi:hypothetical protein [Methylobacterium sp. 285MFTsu5.1]|uniref:hypothetical protein n=1 Tax=Methylobacterium sp. 285MFTsu5.1 TaxID=1172187 RepID=UPI000379DB3E|nr:hypothetical protein [Methylobacterium sp. 285MFTsu5.1]